MQLIARLTEPAAVPAAEAGEREGGEVGGSAAQSTRTPAVRRLLQRSDEVTGLHLHAGEGGEGAGGRGRCRALASNTGAGGSAAWSADHHPVCGPHLSSATTSAG